MKFSKTSIILIIVLLIMFILGAIYFHLNTGNKSAVYEGQSPGYALNGKCGLYVTSPEPGDSVVFPLTVKGVVDNSKSNIINCNWTMFEGQAGVVDMSYKDKNGDWKMIAQSIPIKVDDWTATTTAFSLVVDYDKSKMIIPSGSDLKLTFNEENPSGMPPVNSYDLMLVEK